jgi:hypothetical protein
VLDLGESIGCCMGFTRAGLGLCWRLDENRLTSQKNGCHFWNHELELLKFGMDVNSGERFNCPDSRFAYGLCR